MGYDGHFAERFMGEPEGVALFYNRDKFHLEETKSFHLNDLVAHSFKQTEIPKFAEVVLLTSLRHQTSNNLLVVGKCIFYYTVIYGVDEIMCNFVQYIFPKIIVKVMRSCPITKDII